MTPDRFIGPPLTDAERVAFVAAARGQLGIRFKHQGRTRLGFDCAGLVAFALAAAGRTIKDERAYSREPQGGRLEALLRANLGAPVPVAEMRAGDVPLMRFRGEPSHVGILADHPQGGLMLVHAFAQMRKVVEHGLDAQWLGCITEVFRP